MFEMRQQKMAETQTQYLPF